MLVEDVVEDVVNPTCIIWNEMGVGLCPYSYKISGMSLTSNAGSGPKPKIMNTS